MERPTVGWERGRCQGVNGSGFVWAMQCDDRIASSLDLLRGMHTACFCNYPQPVCVQSDCSLCADIHQTPADADTEVDLALPFLRALIFRRRAPRQHTPHSFDLTGDISHSLSERPNGDTDGPPSPTLSSSR